ncbi:MAG: flagella basal body P-ring formation protein FlgA [Armatimonadota bacterium]
MSWQTATKLLVVLALPAAPSVADGAGASVDAPVTVRLHEAVQVDEGRMTLGELAEIKPEERAAQLGAIEIGPSPLPGGKRELTRGYLKMRLRRGGVACTEIVFTGAEMVEVRRAQPSAPRRQAQGEVEAADAPGARSSTEQPLTVDRGARVRLTVTCGAISIDAEATLLESAAVGGRAKMRVEQTREIVVAQIVQPSEAVISRE